MKRGSIVLVREPKSPASKGRPCIVVQRDSTIDAGAKIIAVPLTSELAGISKQRPVLFPSADNGLRRVSEAQIDWIFTFERSRIGPVIGVAEAEVMPQIDAALRLWLNL